LVKIVIILQKYSKQINMKKLYVIFNLLVAFRVLGLVFTQGNTTSSINGVVSDNGGFARSINFGYSLESGTRYRGQLILVEF
jgi:hypothetical protein